MDRAFARCVSREGSFLRLGEDRADAHGGTPTLELIDLSAFDCVHVISLGKAGHAMAAALRARTGEGWGGIIADPNLPDAPLDGFRYFRGGHPTPNAESVAAAEAILELAQAADARALIIFLISGGGSSVVEQPLSAPGLPDISHNDLIATYRALVLCGAPIEQINAVRKHLSAIKGGRLAEAASPARQVSLLISDVPDAAPDALASGPTVPDRSKVDDVYRIAEQYELANRVPESVRLRFERSALVETPKQSDACFERSSVHVVLSNETARAGAADAAREAGFSVFEDNSCDDWDYERAAEYLLHRLRELRQQHRRVCLISGGEVTVKIVRDAGIGGRNQQFALACASKIAGENFCVLGAGTDGIDGNSPAAGAVVDGSTLSRAQARGLSVQDSLARFDAYPLFDSLCDAVVTGPTGNNVRDLRVLLAG